MHFPAVAPARIPPLLLLACCGAPPLVAHVLEACLPHVAAAYPLLGKVGDTVVHGTVAGVVWVAHEVLLRSWLTTRNGSGRHRASPSAAACSGAPPSVTPCCAPASVTTGVACVERLVSCAHGCMSRAWPRCLSPPLLQAACGGAACVAMATLMDLDHFIAARSWRIEDAAHLSSRPFGHALLFPIVLCILAAALAPARPWPLAVATALGTHQARDAIRRGWWLWPVGSTPPMPYWMYLALYFVWPLALCAARVHWWRHMDAAATEGGGGEPRNHVEDDPREPSPQPSPDAVRLHMPAAGDGVEERARLLVRRDAAR